MAARRLPLAALVAAVLFSLATAVQAAPATWKIDPNHSNVTFTIRHFFSKVGGSFTKFSGEVVYDPANPTASSTKVSIDAASINTANERRDGHLKSADFFDVEKFPTLTFESTKVTADGKKLTIEGNLTMHGVTKPVKLEGEFLGAGPAMGGQRAGFEASTKIDRKEFGIIWNKVADQGAMLGDDVDIRLAIEGVNQPEGEKKAEAGAAGAKSGAAGAPGAKSGAAKNGEASAK